MNSGQLYRALHLECYRVLNQNWRHGTCTWQGQDRAYAYTCPSPGHYPYGWLWDSCFTACVWERFNITRARLELETLLRAQREDGFIGHMFFWESPHRRLSEYVRENVISRSALVTETIQPPFLAFAWERVAKSRDERFVTQNLPRLEAYYDWLNRERNLHGRGLLSIVQPDESGLDAAPKFDGVWGARSGGRVTFPLLIAHNRRRDFVASRIEGPLLEEVLVNVAYILSLDALGRLGADARFATRSEQAKESLLRYSYDPSEALFYDLLGSEGRPVPANDWSNIVPIAISDYDDDLRREVIERHLLSPKEYNAEIPFPSVSMSEESFVPGLCRGPWPLHLPRYARGATWVETLWLLSPALRELGHEDFAENCAHRLGEAVAREGICEYYHAHTGEGLGQRDFAWSTLILDCLLPLTGPLT